MGNSEKQERPAPTVKQPRVRSNTINSRYSGDLNGLTRSISRTSRQSDFVGREVVERELELKHQWLEAKRLEESRREEYLAEVQERVRREELERQVERQYEETLLEEEEQDAKDPNLVEWNDNDPEDPLNWTFRKRFVTTTVCILLVVNVTFASSAPSTTIPYVMQEFHVSQEAAILVTSIFLCGYVAGPIIWAPISELVGRRPVFLFTILIYALFQIGQAKANSFATLITTRFFAGLFAAAPLTNCGGVIADIWDPIRRGTATALFSGSVFLGPVMGPIIGGFVSQSYLGWRWVFWIIMIFAGACWVLLIIYVPETYSPILLSHRAKKMRKQDPEKWGEKYAAVDKADFSFNGLMERTILRPFLMLLKEPILVLVTIYLSIIYGLLYALFSVFPLIWQKLRGFNPGQGGLIFIGIGIGTSIGAYISIRVQSHYKVLVPKWHGCPPPEERLLGAMYAGPLLVIGIFWLGWSGAYPSVPWYVPALATIPVGASFTLIFISYLSYIVDTYLMFAASALAANTIFRSAVGAAFPLFTSQMFEAMTIQGACSLIGGVGILLMPIPFVFYKYGAKIREKSTFAPCFDIKLRPQVEAEERERQEKEKQANGVGLPHQHSDVSTAV